MRSVLSMTVLVVVLVSGCADDDAGTPATGGEPPETVGTTIEAAFADFPWTFRGTGAIRVNASSDFGSRGSAAGDSTADFEIVLTADGLVTGVYTNHLGTHYWCGVRDGDVTLEEGAWELSLSGSHDNAGHFTMSTIWGEVTGTYGTDYLSGHALTVETEPPGEICTGTTHWEGELEIVEMPRQH